MLIVVEVEPAEFRAVTVYVPDTVKLSGVPEMVPVTASILRPAERAGVTL
jgi:hypothetical protein